MPNIEEVIRHALGKIDKSRVDLRERVYRAVWESHERKIIADTQLSNDERSMIRNNLITLIQSIEAEYDVSTEDVSQNNEEVNVSSKPDDVGNKTLDESGNDNSSELASKKVVAEDDKLSASNQQVRGVEDKPNSIANTAHKAGPEELGVAPTNDQAHKAKKRSWWRSNILLMVLLAIALLVVWAFYNSFTVLNRSDNQQDNNTMPVSTIDQQNQLAQKEGWVTVFDASRISEFSVQGAAKARIVGEGNDRALRFTTSSDADRVIIDIGKGVLEPLRGKTVTLNVIARSSKNENARITIMCDFASNNSCVKRSFDLYNSREDLLFSVEVTQNIITSGRLILQNAFLGHPNQIDLLAVRIRIEK